MIKQQGTQKPINCRTWASFISNHLKGTPCRIKIKHLSFAISGGNQVVNIILPDGTLVAEYKKDFEYFKSSLLYDIPSNIRQFKTDTEAQEYVRISGLNLRKPDSSKFNCSVYYDGYIVNDVTLCNLINKLLILQKVNTLYYEFIPWYSEHVVCVDY